MANTILPAPPSPRSADADLYHGVLVPDPQTCELTLTHVHAGVTVDQVRAATGWELAVAADVTQTEPPTPEELKALRDLRGAEE